MDSLLTLNGRRDISFVKNLREGTRLRVCESIQQSDNLCVPLSVNYKCADVAYPCDTQSGPQDRVA
jgi:hypothetical protein